MAVAQQDLREAGMQLCLQTLARSRMVEWGCRDEDILDLNWDAGGLDVEGWIGCAHEIQFPGSNQGRRIQTSGFRGHVTPQHAEAVCCYIFVLLWC